MQRQDVVGGVGAEGYVPSEHLEQQDSGAVQIAARVGCAVGRLLGCEVGRGAHEQRCPVVSVLDGAREPEIGDLHFAPVTEQDVLRLDVAMNETR